MSMGWTPSKTRPGAPIEAGRLSELTGSAMPSPATPPGGGPAHPQPSVSDTVAARVAAYYAGKVPGVRRLRPSLAQSLVSVTTRLFSPRDREPRISTDGVTA